MQNFSGPWHEKDAFIFPIGKVFLPDHSGIAVSQVDLTAHLRRYCRCQRDTCARRLYSVFVRTQSMNVSRMGEHSPRMMVESIPLFEEVVAAVIPDLPDRSAVRCGDLPNMRGVEDELAAVSEHRFELV